MFENIIPWQFPGSAISVNDNPWRKNEDDDWFRKFPLFLPPPGFGPRRSGFTWDALLNLTVKIHSIISLSLDSIVTELGIILGVQMPGLVADSAGADLLCQCRRKRICNKI